MNNVVHGIRQIPYLLEIICRSLHQRIEKYFDVNGGHIEQFL
jgi:hypothetical protein